MAEGFKVADAYIAVHTEDDTRRGREQISRDNDRWSKETGDRAGENIGNRMLAKIGTALRGLLGVLMKFAMVSTIVGVLGGAVAALGGYVVQLMSGVNTLAIVISQAVGALLLLPGAIVTLVGSLLTIKLAFSGVGAALKAGMQQAGGGVQEQVDKILKAFEKLSGAALGWRAAERGAEAAFDNLASAALASAFSFDISNEKGRAAAQALDDVVKAAQQAAQAKYNETGSMEEANAVYNQYISRLRDTLIAQGMASDQVDTLLNQIGRFPTKFEDAAAGANAFNDAMKKLSPNAQALVRALLQLKGAFDQVKFNLQDAMFAGLADQLREVAVTLLPVLNTGFFTLGTALNGVARQFLAFLGSTKGQNNLLGIFANMASTIDHVATALKPLLTLITTVLNISTAAISDLTEGLGDKAAGWAAQIEAMADSGRLREIIDQSLHALKQIGSALVDIWGIVTGIFKAAGEGDFFGVLDRLNKLLNSPEVQANLKTIFDALKVAGDALTPVLGTLLKQLGPLLTGLATVMVKIAPFLDFALEVLGNELTKLLVPLTPVVTTLLSVITAALPATEQLLEVLAGLIVGLGPGVVDLLSSLGPAIAPLIAVAPILGRALGDILTALVPLIIAVLPYAAQLFEVLAQVIVELAPVLAPLIVEMLPLLVDAVIQIAPLLPDLVKSFTDLMLAVMPLVPPLIQLYIWFQKLFVLTVLQPIIVGLTWLFKGLVWVINWLVDSLKEAYHWFDDDGPIERFFKRLGKFFSGLWNQVQEFWDWVTGLPGRIGAELVNFGTLLYDRGRDLVMGLINGIRSRAADLVKTIRESITDLIPQWIKDRMDMHSPSKLMERLGVATMDGYIIGVQKRTPALQGLLGAAIKTPAVSALLPPGVTGGGATAAGRGETYILVQIGNEVVTDHVVATIGSNPEAVAQAADEGDRRLAFVNPSRKRVGAR